MTWSLNPLSIPLLPTHRPGSHSSLEPPRCKALPQWEPCLPSTPHGAPPGRLSPCLQLHGSRLSLKGTQVLQQAWALSWPPSYSSFPPHWTDPGCVWASASVSLPSTAVSSSPRLQPAFPEHLKLTFFRKLNLISCTKGLENKDPKCWPLNPPRRLHTL